MSGYNRTKHIILGVVMIILISLLIVFCQSILFAQPLQIHEDVIVELPEGEMLVEEGVILGPEVIYREVPPLDPPALPHYNRPVWPSPNEGPWVRYYVYFYPGSAPNMLCMSILAMCVGTYHYGSCDISTMLLDLLISLDPNDDAYWASYDSKWGEGYIGGRHSLSRKFYRIWRFNSCLQYSGTFTLDWSHIPPWLRNGYHYGGFDDNGQVILDPPPSDEELNPAQSIAIVEYDYDTGIDHLDLRERIYLKLTKLNSNPESKPMVLPVDMTLETPGGQDAEWVTLVYYYGTTNTNLRIYLSDPNEIILPRDHAIDLQSWTEGPQEQVRDLTATYGEDPQFQVTDAAVAHHNLFEITEDVDQGALLFRGGDAKYAINLDPAITTYDITIEKWLFEPIDVNLEPVEILHEATSDAVSITEDSEVEGAIVADGKITATAYFENNPETYVDNIEVEIQFWNSQDYFDINVSPRDWGFSTDDVEIMRLKDMPENEISCPPLVSPGYPYANLLDIKLVDGNIVPARIDALDNLRFSAIQDGPNEGYVFIPVKPFTYYLQPYIYPGLSEGVNLNSPHLNACYVFNARQGDHKLIGAPPLEIDWNSLKFELAYGMGYDPDDPDTYKGRAAEALDHVNGPNDASENFVKMSTDDGEQMKEALIDDLELIIASDMALVDNIDETTIRRQFNDRDAQWSPYSWEVHFCDGRTGQREVIYDGVTRNASETAILKLIVPGQDDIGVQPDARFTIEANDPNGPDPETTNWLDYNNIAVNGAVRYWQFENVASVFGFSQQEMDSYLTQGAELTAEVNVAGNPTDMIELNQFTDMQIEFCNANYDPVENSAKFYAGWEQVWYRITGTDGQLLPGVQVRLLPVGAYIPVDPPVWDPGTSSWRGTIDVSQILLPFPEIVDGNALEVKSTLGNEEATDDLYLFDIKLKNATLRTDQSIAETFITVARGKTEEKLTTRVQGVNMRDDELVTHFSNTPPTGKVMDNAEVQVGTSTFVLGDPISFPIAALYFKVSSWNITTTPAINVGRLLALKFEAQATYTNVMSGWWGVMPDITKTSELLIQDGKDILRQEYDDYYFENYRWIFPYEEVHVGGLFTNAPDAHWHTIDGVDIGQREDEGLWYSFNNIIQRAKPLVLEYVELGAVELQNGGWVKFDSGFRCPVRNDQISGSVPQSYHQTGRALDFIIKNMPYQDLEQQRTISSKVYNVFDEIDLDSKQKVLIYGHLAEPPYTYIGLLSRFRFRDSNEVELRNYPDPAEWGNDLPFEYKLSSGEWKPVFYIQGHVQYPN